MKIAVCLYGLPRYYEYTKQYMDIFYKGIDIDFFIHSWGDDKIYKQLKKFYSPKKILIEEQKDFSNYLDFEPDMSQNTKGISNTISPLYSIFKVGELLESDNSEYDFIVFTRTDIVATGIPLLNLIQKDILYTSYTHGDIWQAEKDSFLNVVDAKFFCSSKPAMVFFSKLYTKIIEYLKTDKILLCHHRLMYYHLKKLKMPFQMLKPEPNLYGGGWFYVRDNILTDS